MKSGNLVESPGAFENNVKFEVFDSLSEIPGLLGPDRLPPGVSMVMHEEEIIFLGIEKLGRNDMLIIPLSLIAVLRISNVFRR